MRDDLRQEGKVPVRSERLTIERILRDTSLAIFLRTIMGVESRLQDELDDGLKGFAKCLMFSTCHSPLLWADLFTFTSPMDIMTI